VGLGRNAGFERQLDGAKPALAEAAVDEEVRERVRTAGKANLSRAVTELANAGLVKRHYQGYRVDPLNRGAQYLNGLLGTETASAALAEM
jgi:hypothetical protein